MKKRSKHSYCEMRKRIVQQIRSNERRQEHEKKRQERVEQIVSLRKKGMTYRQICAELRTSCRTVIDVFKVHPDPVKARRENRRSTMKLMRNQGWSYNQIGKLMGTHSRTVWRMLNAGSQSKEKN